MYVDILFVINFAMNYVSLYLAGRLTHDPMTLPRITAAAALGAALGVVVCAFGFAGIPLLMLEIAAAVVMSIITYGFCSVRRLALNSIAVFAIASLIGGLMTVGDGIAFAGDEGRRNLLEVFLLALPAFAAVFLILRIPGKRCAAKTAYITAEFGGRSSSFTALIDSGNLVTEPISAMPAILASAEAVSGMLGETALSLAGGKISDGIAAKIRAVPIRSHDGARIEYGIIPDKVTVSVGKKTRAVRAVIVPENRGREAYGGFAATCPSTLT